MVLRGQDSHGVISLEAVAEGEGFKVSAGAAVTGDWVPGNTRRSCMP